MKKKWSENYSLRPTLAGLGVGIGTIGFGHLFYSAGFSYIYEDDRFLDNLKDILKLHIENNGINGFNGISAVLIAMITFVVINLYKKDREEKAQKLK